MLTPQEFLEWKELSVTKALMSRLKKDLVYLKDLLTGVSLDDLQNLQGRCKAIENLLNVEYEDLTNE